MMDEHVGNTVVREKDQHSPSTWNTWIRSKKGQRRVFEVLGIFILLYVGLRAYLRNHSNSLSGLTKWMKMHETVHRELLIRQLKKQSNDPDLIDRLLQTETGTEESESPTAQKSYSTFGTANSATLNTLSALSTSTQQLFEEGFRQTSDLFASFDTSGSNLTTTSHTLISSFKQMPTTIRNFFHPVYQALSQWIVKHLTSPTDDNASSGRPTGSQLRSLWGRFQRHLDDFLHLLPQLPHVAIE